MKKMLLLLGALIFAVPAWATDTAVTPTTSEPSALTSTISQTVKGLASDTLNIVIKDAHAAACPQTCRVMACPPPSGPVKLCCPLAACRT